MSGRRITATARRTVRVSGVSAAISLRDDPLHVGRCGEDVVEQDRPATRLDGSHDLECQERITTGCLLKPCQRGTRERFAQALLDEVVETGERQPTEPERGDPVGREWRR